MKRVFWIGGAALAYVACAVACGTSATSGGGGAGGNGSGTNGSASLSTGGSTASAMNIGGSATSAAGGSDQGGSTGTTSSGGGGCETPSTLHPPELDGGTNTLYCPFSGVDGGKNQYCEPSTEHCCEPVTKGVPSTCSPSATPCDMGDTDWACEDPKSDCPADSVCCGIGTVEQDPSCMNWFGSHFNGTHCVAAATGCAAGTEVVMCTSNDECTTPGQTCVPFEAKANQVGFCN